MLELDHPIFVCDRGVAAGAAAELDGLETAILQVARSIFETLEDPEKQCWMTAFLDAERAFPPPLGATVAHAIVVAIRAVASERLRNFSYVRATDPEAGGSFTDEERYFLFALRAIRTQDRPAARMNALMLCEGGDSAPLLAALERIVMIVDGVEEPLWQ